MAISEVYQLSIVAGLIEEQLDPEDIELLVLLEIGWYAIHKTVKPYYKLKGRQAKDSRLMIGLLILKHRLDLSDQEAVCRAEGELYWRVSADCMDRWT